MRKYEEAKEQYNMMQNYKVLYEQYNMMRKYEELNEKYNRFVPVEYGEFDDKEQLDSFLKSCLKELDQNLKRIYESVGLNPLIAYFTSSKIKYQNMKKNLNDDNYWEIKRLLSFSLIFDNENKFLIQNGKEPNKYYSTVDRFINDKSTEIGNKYKSPRI